MPQITVNQQSLEVTRVIKIRSGLETDAARDARFDGADNVLFAIGADTYVASGRGLNLKNIHRGDRVNFSSQTGVVILTDDEINSAWDGMVSGLKTGLQGSLPGGIVVGAFGSFFTYAHATAINRDIAEVAPRMKRVPAGKAAGRAGLIAAAVTAVALPVIGAVGGAVDGALRKPDFERLKGYGQGM